MSPTAIVFLGVFLVGSSMAQVQTDFPNLSLAALHRIMPFAADDKAANLCKTLNSKMTDLAGQKTAVNNFFTAGNHIAGGKIGMKTLSQFDNATFSKAKLIALLSQRQALKKWFNNYTTVVTRVADAATATKHKKMFMLWDINYMNSIEYSLAYFLVTIAFSDNDGKLTDAVVDTFNAAETKTPEIAFILYTEAFMRNHNQTYMTGKW
ncbi:unnamed protein product [Caenorhabditis auriculariae]|uniref:SXP/RAL-2 family protein Ani s 5-like cation-binding domain-containing protein n=1 Tax=Caenorhabditis auriculariae TaxID=2777116 RepID=A0A8S1H464_9PELO|nr:unnamed protein product [Caenorhabditis auriculariae]